MLFFCCEVVLLRGGGGVGRAFAILLFLFCFKLEETGEHGGVYTSVVSVSCSQSDDAMMTTKSLVCFFKVQLTNTVTYLSTSREKEMIFSMS